MDVLKHIEAQSLLLLLTRAGSEGMRLDTVQADLRACNLLTALDVEGLIEFGNLNHYIDYLGKPVIEKGFNWSSWIGPSRLPFDEFVPKLLSKEPPDLRPWVRLTAKGRSDAAKLSLSAIEPEATDPENFLKGQALILFQRLLRSKNYVLFDSLAEVDRAFKVRRPEARTIESALERLNAKLRGSNYAVEIRASESRAKLEKLR